MTMFKTTQAPDPNQYAFDRSIEITLNQLAAAREILIKMAGMHEPNPALVAGLVNAMATNYLAEMTGKPPAKPEPGFNPLSTQKLRVDFDSMETWPALNEVSRKRNN
jgi:hypothetical protein